MSSVCTLVRRTLPQVGLVSLERIQNKWLWDRYYFAKERMHEKNKGLINEKWLFHGTRQNPPERIYRSEQGFDFRSLALPASCNLLAIRTYVCPV